MDPLRTIALIPLGLIGARLMGAVQQNHFGPNGLFGRATMGVVASGWFGARHVPRAAPTSADGCQSRGARRRGDVARVWARRGSRGSGAPLRSRYAAQSHTVCHHLFPRGRVPSTGHRHRHVALRARSHWRREQYRSAAATTPRAGGIDDHDGLSSRRSAWTTRAFIWIRTDSRCTRVRTHCHGDGDESRFPAGDGRERHHTGSDGRCCSPRSGDLPQSARPRTLDARAPRGIARGDDPARQEQRLRRPKLE